MSKETELCFKLYNGSYCVVDQHYGHVVVRQKGARNSDHGCERRQGQPGADLGLHSGKQASARNCDGRIPAEERCRAGVYHGDTMLSSVGILSSTRSGMGGYEAEKNSVGTF